MIESKNGFYLSTKTWWTLAHNIKELRGQNPTKEMLKIAASRNILQGGVLSDHPEASQGTWKIRNKTLMSSSRRQAKVKAWWAEQKAGEREIDAEPCKGKYKQNTRQRLQVLWARQVTSQRAWDTLWNSQGKSCELWAKAKTKSCETVKTKPYVW